MQGVGFRPFVYRLAQEEGLAGWVLNDERGVLLEIEGDSGAVSRMVGRIDREHPPLAVVERVERSAATPTGEPGFSIRSSPHGGVAAAPVAADAAVCADCLAELEDPADRRHRYPFINCTNCGPRFTIVRAVPYDRPLTTMAGFKMCADCQAEYDDPGDRRFHAQPNACPACGPAVRLLAGSGREAVVRDPIAAAAEGLSNGLVVAVKGLGGYHLACRCDDEAAVAALRTRKHREDRPFALMARSVGAARDLVELSGAEEALLAGRERPIVIARRRRNAPVAISVAPRSPDLGVMLPYTPLHRLLLAEGGTGPALVMTSGNLSDEPIAFDDADAVERLDGIAELFLTHDRPIHIRTDDSVLRSVGSERPLFIRRSRGYVPGALDLPLGMHRPVLATGAEQKSTFCVAKGRHAWVSHHIGDLENWETLESFRTGIEHFQRLFAVEPAIVAHDRHPEYLSTKYALERDGVDLVAVQHHHAHLAACLAEHGERRRAVGAIFDGTGFGLDGTVWGGELLVGDLPGFDRAGHLHPVRLPGGARAIRQPWRMACAWLVAIEAGDPAVPARLRDSVDPDRWRQIAQLCVSGTAAPVTTSAGRLFDGVAALCGLSPDVSYEGQAAIELEALADVRERVAYPLPFTGGVLDARVTVAAVRDDLSAGVDPAIVAGRFHNGVAAGTAVAVMELAEEAGVDIAVLSGGVFQNRLLLERTTAGLGRSGLRVLRPERLPPNDGGISYGQAAVASAGLT